MSSHTSAEDEHIVTQNQSSTDLSCVLRMQARIMRRLLVNQDVYDPCVTYFRLNRIFCCCCEPPSSWRHLQSALATTLLPHATSILNMDQRFHCWNWNSASTVMHISGCFKYVYWALPFLMSSCTAHTSLDCAMMCMKRPKTALDQEVQVIGALLSSQH